MSVVDEIKSRLDIVDIISQYVPSLKKTGRTYKGLCPFHTEKTPSFVVFPDSQNWHCFGACGTGGDVFSFLMRQEGYNFRETLEELAAKTGVPLHERSSEEIESDKARQKLLDIVAAASAYFHQYLLESPQAQFVRDYVTNERGLSAETVNAFQLGYAPNQWEALKAHLVEKGYAEVDLVSAGLVVERDDGSPGYDRFRNRLVVPIRDDRGRVIGFGGRALQQNQVPKYLNSPQGPLFDKSRTLYGLDMAKSTIRDQDEVVIVEGYMDALQAHNQGFQNVVAQMGTALTEAQLQILKRYTKKFVLALDADNAGSAATLRGIDVVRRSLSESVLASIDARGALQYSQRLEAKLYVASLPQGQDPDDILRVDPEEWQRLVGSALPLVDYYIQAVTTELDLDSVEGKSAAVHAIIPILQELNDAIEQEHYLQELSRLVKINERTLRDELQRQISPPQSGRSTVRKTSGPVSNKAYPPPPLPPDPVSSAPLRETQPADLEVYCLATVVGHPQLLDQVNRFLHTNTLDLVSVNDFAKAENQALFLTLKDWASSETTTLDSLLVMVDETVEGQLASLLAIFHQQPEYPPEQAERALVQSVLSLRLRRLTKRNKELSQLQDDAYQTQDRESLLEYQSLSDKIREQRKKIEGVMNALSVMGQRRATEKYP